MNRLFIRWFCQFRGMDDAGNKYYEGRSTDHLGKRRRYVIYNGDNEPSAVPPLWHAWLHYLSDDYPKKTNGHRFAWQQDHSPNMTGTNFAYCPSGHKHAGRPGASSDYHRWQPKT